MPFPPQNTLGWEAGDRDLPLSHGNLEMFATTFDANFFHLFLRWARCEGCAESTTHCRTVVLNLWVVTP